MDPARRAIDIFDFDRVSADRRCRLSHSVPLLRRQRDRHHRRKHAVPKYVFNEHSAARRRTETVYAQGGRAMPGAASELSAAGPSSMPAY